MCYFLHLARHVIDTSGLLESLCRLRLTTTATLSTRLRLIQPNRFCNNSNSNSSNSFISKLNIIRIPRQQVTMAPVS